jgi:hypothetical protein
MTAQILTAGHEPLTPNPQSRHPELGDEQKIIFRNHISGKQRNSCGKTIQHVVLTLSPGGGRGILGSH